MFGEEKTTVAAQAAGRSNRRTQLIDCRKKSTRAIDAIQ